MSVLRDELSDFVCTIVHGNGPSAGINTNYSNYPVGIALEVYRNNYRGNLHDALAGAYPVTKQLVGEEFFRHMTWHFVEQYPSCCGNLHHYGKQMASFVASFAPAQGLPYLQDVAELEWACHRAYFADDTPGLNTSKLAQIPPEQYAGLILHTHPAYHLVCSCYPIAAIWHAHQPGASVDFHIDLDSGSSNALVSRKNDVVTVTELSEADATWLQVIQAATPLGGATASTLEKYPDFNLQNTLLKLFEHNVFAGFNQGDLP
jgi:hypothetical protein